MRDEVTVQIDAPPEAVWALVSDVTNTGRFSPETFEAEWLDGATGPGVGARFRGHVRRTGMTWVSYWTTCTVVACEPGREFTFVVGSPERWVNKWSYRFEPDGRAATFATESFELRDMVLTRWYWKLRGAKRGKVNVDGMRTTLGRVKAVAEAPEASPAAP